jgi:hypothetical protein
MGFQHSPLGLIQPILVTEDVVAYEIMFFFPQRKP